GSCGGNDDLPEGQPASFTGGTMRPYQIEGLRWLKVLYENGVNGILADEMGLGKTIQVIALVAGLADSGLPGPYLVVAPLSTLTNWLAEFRRFTPSLTSLLYHGTKEQRAELVSGATRGQDPETSALRRATVVLTSYEVAMRDRAKLAPLDWGLLVVDEAHRLKNFRCRLMRELAQYNAPNRLLLTGTPLQNSLTELWALLHFLIPEIFNDLRAFESWFDMSSLSEGEGTRFVEQEQTNQLVGTMQEILRPFLLRRTKDEVELDLPTKTELLVYASLSPLQEKLYKICVDGAVKAVSQQEEDLDPSEQEGGRPRRSRRSIRYVDPGEDDPWEDDASRSPGHGQEDATREPKDPLDELRHSRNPLMDLRKICNHPYLFRWVDPTGPADEELVAASGKLRLLDCMLPELRRRKHKVLLFSQMTRVLDILEDYCHLRHFRHCRLDGRTKVEDRQLQMHLFNNDPSYFVFLLSTRAGGLGINLTGGDTVVLFDSDWNPQCDLQAMDRCHRIGQTRPVVVYRLVTRGTVEQRMVERASAKRKLEKIIMQKGARRFSRVGESSRNALSPQELLELLRSSEHSRVVDTHSSALSAEQLDALLDRSRAPGNLSSHRDLFKVVVRETDAMDNLT
ncbi:helicase, putative, partial [Ixodes scapularis]